MLPTDEMVRAAAHQLDSLGTGDEGPLLGLDGEREYAENALAAAFDAVDRDELVDAAADALASTGLEHALRERAEVVLRAVGLLP